MDAAAPARPGRKKSDPGRSPSSEALLEAAREVFAAHGLEGARVDDIARRAGVNKQLVYHYFDSKDGLYAAVLEHVYGEIRRREQELDLSRFPAEEAMRRLVEFSFDYLAEHPDFVSLLADENAHGGRHLQTRVEEVNRPIVDLIRDTLSRGEENGVFRKGLDPLHVYLSIAGMAYFYFANIHTLSRIFNRTLAEEPAVSERRAHIVDFVLNSIRIR